MSADVNLITTRLALLFVLTSCNLRHVTCGVNTANGVGVGRVYVSIEDQSCKKEEEISH